MAEHQQWRQYVVAGVANSLVACVGYCAGWSAPIAPKLRDPTSSPLHSIPNSEEIAWMGSLLTIGAIFGPFIGGSVAAKLGRKWGLMSACVPLMFGWVLVVLAVNMIYLYAARILWGIATSMVYMITPIYCAEIATDNIRGALCSFIQVFVTVGYLMAYSIGSYMSYLGIAYVGITCVAAFAVIFFFMPETPTYYLLKNDREAAAACLCVLRGCSRASVEAELNVIEINVSVSNEKSAKVTDVFRGTNFKALSISCTLMVLQQFSGINAVLFNLTDIFKDSGIELEPGIATIIIGIVQVVASFVTIFVVDRLGRRLLLMFSSGGAAVGLILLGMCFLLEANGSAVMAKINILPVLSLVLFVVAFCSGLGQLPWTIMGELFSIEVKSIAALITTLVSCLTGFLVTRFFDPVAIALGQYAAFWLFAVFCVIAFFFTMFLVPETKGKSFQEIQDMLAGRKSLKAEKL